MEEKVAYFLTPMWKSIKNLDEVDQKNTLKFLFRLMKDIEKSVHFPEHSLRPDFKTFSPDKNQDELFASEEQKVQSKNIPRVSEKEKLENDDDDDMSANIVNVSQQITNPRNCCEEIQFCVDKTRGIIHN